MRNYLFVFLVVLIFSTSFNQGEKLKSNDRRASGLMAYPRIGRSDLPASNLNFNRHHDTEPDSDFQLYLSNFDSTLDKGYEGTRNLLADRFPLKSMIFEQINKVPKEAKWIISDQLRAWPWLKFDGDSRSSHISSYTPRLGRENDVERTLCK